MKKIIFGFLALIGIMMFVSCDDTETYAEQRDRERDSISAYLKLNHVTVISESEFLSRFNDEDYTGPLTNTAKNEFVLFENTGIYLQIIDQGCGNRIQNGEQAVPVLCRFTEYNLLNSAKGDSIQASNNVIYYSYLADKMIVSNSYGNFSASFDPVSSLMYRLYKSTSVPTGWLIPLSYLNIGRPTSEADKIAHVKIIVPHAQGTPSASANVIPMLYDITYEGGQGRN